MNNENNETEVVSKSASTSLGEFFTFIIMWAMWGVVSFAVAIPVQTALQILSDLYLTYMNTYKVVILTFPFIYALIGIKCLTKSK